ncbi:MAG: hypothetical protein HQK51_06645 [Oligoflexia bacterium]|nr:hypothetical protein [Oligoflexia bacterium]
MAQKMVNDPPKIKKIDIKFWGSIAVLFLIIQCFLFNQIYAHEEKKQVTSQVPSEEDLAICGPKPNSSDVQLLTKNSATLNEIRSLMPPVRSQERTSWCQAFSTSALLSYHNNRAKYDKLPKNSQGKPDEDKVNQLQRAISDESSIVSPIAVAFAAKKYEAELSDDKTDDKIPVRQVDFMDAADVIKSLGQIQNNDFKIKSEKEIHFSPTNEKLTTKQRMILKNALIKIFSDIPRSEAETKAEEKLQTLENKLGDRCSFNSILKQERALMGLINDSTQILARTPSLLRGREEDISIEKDKSGKVTSVKIPLDLIEETKVAKISGGSITIDPHFTVDHFYSENLLDYLKHLRENLIKKIPSKISICETKRAHIMVNGIIPEINTPEDCGHHAVVVVGAGWLDNVCVVDIRNSYGDNSGVNGDGHIRFTAKQLTLMAQTYKLSRKLESPESDFLYQSIAIIPDTAPSTTYSEEAKKGVKILKTIKKSTGTTIFLGRNGDIKGRGEEKKMAHPKSSGIFESYDSNGKLVESFARNMPFTSEGVYTGTLHNERQLEGEVKYPKELDRSTIFTKDKEYHFQYDIKGSEISIKCLNPPIGAHVTSQNFEFLKQKLNRQLQLNERENILRDLKFLISIEENQENVLELKKMYIIFNQQGSSSKIDKLLEDKFKKEWLDVNWKEQNLKSRLDNFSKSIRNTETRDNSKKIFIKLIADFRKIKWAPQEIKMARESFRKEIMNMENVITKEVEGVMSRTYQSELKGDDTLSFSRTTESKKKLEERKLQAAKKAKESGEWGETLKIEINNLLKEI